MYFLGIFLTIHFTVWLIFSLWLWNICCKYYKPYYYKDKKTGEIKNAHDKFEVFRVKDKKISFIRTYLASLFLVPIRIILIIFIAISLYIRLKIINKRGHPDIDPDRQEVVKAVKFWIKLFFKVMGIKITEKKVSYEEVYKKYLGPDYKIDINDNNYSLVICNHTGFFDVVFNLWKFVPGFIAKKEIRNYAFIGPIAEAIGCLFVNRESKEARHEIFVQLSERQKNYMEKKTLCPLVIYPEGTCTAGRHLLKFKKGAFSALLPVKPRINNFYPEDDHTLAVGSTDLTINWLRALTYLTHRQYYIDLPVIRPTPYMYQKYAHFGNEQWEIYAEVARNICSEIAGLKLSDNTLKTNITYQKVFKIGKYVDENDD